MVLFSLPKKIPASLFDSPCYLEEISCKVGAEGGAWRYGSMRNPVWRVGDGQEDIFFITGFICGVGKKPGTREIPRNPKE